MKKTLALIFFAAIMGEYSVAQPYGRQYYPSSSVMSSGYRTTTPGNQGFIMAGTSGATIHIDKTSTGGTMPSQTGPISFQKNYTLSAGGQACLGLPVGTVTPQAGVCAIEAVVANQPYQYIMAANFPEGVSVTYIDGNGAVVNTVAFNFPSTATNLVRPTVTQKANGEVFVCGSYNFNIYVIKIKPNATLDWSFIYSVTGNSQASYGAFPKDMIISRPTGEVVIVGSVMPGAFYLKLNANTGGVNVFTTYGPNGDCQFNTIKNTVNGDFVVGGLYLNSLNTPAGNPIMMRLNQPGGIIWNTRLITGVPGQNSFSEIVGIEERFNPNNASLEYYGVTETNNNGCTIYGMSVFKLDGAGNPAPGNNEFHYANDLINSVVNLSINDNNPATNDVGFHILASGSAASVNGHLLQESYFNGVTSGNSNCPEVLTVCTSAQGPNPMSHQINRQPGLMQCNDITTTDATSGSINSICIANSVAGGSNLKATLSVQEQAENSKGLNVRPNPGNGIYTLELSFNAQLVVFDIFGKKVLETPLKSGNNSINLTSYPSGIYSARISGNDKIETIQLIKE